MRNSYAVSDGIGYAGSNAGTITAFDTATGRERWHANANLGNATSPSPGTCCTCEA